MNVHVARQPIFDCQKNVYAYELLFRSGVDNFYDADDPDKATVDVVSNSLFDIGLDRLTDGRRAFINFTENLLRKGVASLLPKESITIEILEDVEPNDEIIRACRSLKESGRELAMDDFVSEHEDSPLIEFADIVKVDFMGTQPDDRRRICGNLRAQGIKVLAEKVETAEEFDAALDWGYSYFQGYFFSKPEVHSGKRLAGNKFALLQILAKVNQPDVTNEELQELVKQDVSLTYRLLRFINSAWFGVHAEIQSIQHALVLMGRKEVKKWFALVALNEMADGKPHELMLRAIARAKLAEGLAPILGMAERSSELFLLGMFSLIDAVLDSEMAEILEELPLDVQIKKALLNEECSLRTILDMILSYERGEWEEFSRQANELGINEELVPSLVLESQEWANEALSAV